MSTLRNVSALIAAVVIVQLAQSLLAVQIPLAIAADGLSRTVLGSAAAAYAAGFMAGAWYGPRLLARVGHIRVYAGCAAIAAASTLALHGADDAPMWLIVRLIAGAAFAAMLAAVESWMNASIGKTERGHIIGVYSVCTKAALALGAFFAFGAGGAAPEPLMVAGALLALSMLPVCFTAATPPEAPKAEPLALRALFRTAPAAVVSCVGAGVINAGVLALAPVYAADLYGPATATAFYASGWIGSLILQWPAGWLSDRVDRRIVIAGLCALAASSALALTLFGGTLPFAAAAGLYALWGAGSLSFYGIGVAHMADRAEPSQMARATSGLLFVWAAGSIAGPLLQGPIVDAAGPRGVFAFSAAALMLLTIAMLWRRTAREPTPQPEKAPFQNQPATSTAAAELTYGAGGGHAAQTGPTTGPKTGPVAPDQQAP